MIDLTVKKELKINDFSQTRKKSGIIREQTILEAISFGKGYNKENKLYTPLYEYHNYDIGVSKPGKEVYEYSHKTKDGGKTNNENDMTPTIRFNRKNIGITPTFTEIFEVFENLMHEESEILEVFGSIIIRMAFLCDHRKVEGVYRYRFPSASSTFLKPSVKSLGELPIEVFFYMLETLALNEDVKYHTLGYNTFTLGYGRRNNLLTYAYIIAVFLRRASLSKFAGSFSRPPSGVAPLPQKEIFECFPILT